MVDQTSQNESQKMNQFLQLYSIHQSRFYAYIITIVANLADADDIFQETTTEMWRKFDQFSLGSDFVAWGMTIARYKIMEYHRHRKKSILFGDDTIETLEARLHQMFENGNFRIDALKFCLKKLCHYDRWIIMLRYQDELTVKAISERIGRNIQHVYRLLARIHDGLRYCITQAITQEDV